jgi:Zn-dependent protease/CBS domain-containing protein
MRNGFRIVRIFDINIEVDWSWLLIFVLITWNLTAIFSASHTAWGTALVWGLGIAASLLFFLSVLLHELAHSLVAKARGLPVRRIMLFLFGGVSNIEREPASPGTEFWMALVGPLTSLVIGLVLLAGGSFAAPVTEVVNNPQNTLAHLSPLSTLLLWLGSVNVFLAVFNMVPGFPLDGGRVLRSILWAISHNLRQATHWASLVGQGIAWLMILAGFAMAFGVQIPFFGSGFVSGIWLVFIGWFLNSSSVSSYRQMVIHDVLKNVPVTRVMRSNPPTVSPNLTVDQLIDDGVMGTDDHAFPVVEQDHLVGLVTLEDVRAIPRTSWADTLVQQIMTPTKELVSVAPEEDAADALTKLRSRDVRQLPVMRDGALVGLVRRRDIVKWLQLQSDLSGRNVWPAP